MRKHKPKPTAQLGNKFHPRLLVNGHVAIKQCRHGMFMYNLNDLCVGRLLDVYGEWAEAELICLGQLLKSGDIVIDVGANIGTHTVFFSTKVAPSGKVYAIEPQRGTYEFLCANLALNNQLNVLPLQVAASDQPGEIIVPVLDPSAIQNFAALNIEGHSNGDIVKVIQLDSLELTRCNLIKIDVEGMELKVLHGAEKTIRNRRPYLFVENNKREGAPEVVQLLLDFGYTCWWQIAYYFNPDNFFQNKEMIWTDTGPEPNMICVPNEFNLNVTGFEPVIGPSDNWMLAMDRISKRKR